MGVRLGPRRRLLGGYRIFCLFRNTVSLRVSGRYFLLRSTLVRIVTYLITVEALNLLLRWIRISYVGPWLLTSGLRGLALTAVDLLRRPRWESFRDSMVNPIVRRRYVGFSSVGLDTRC